MHACESPAVQYLKNFMVKCSQVNKSGKSFPSHVLLNRLVSCLYSGMRFYEGRHGVCPFMVLSPALVCICWINEWIEIKHSAILGDSRFNKLRIFLYNKVNNKPFKNVKDGFSAVPSLSVCRHLCEPCRTSGLVVLLITLKHHSTVAVLAILLSQRDKVQRLVGLSFK